MRSFRRPPTGLADGFGTEAIPTADADSPHYLGLVPRLAASGDWAAVAAGTLRGAVQNGDRDEHYPRFDELTVVALYAMGPPH